MKHIRGYRLFESGDGLTDEQRKFLDEVVSGRWSVNREGLVDIRGSFSCLQQNLENFLGLNFGTVSGYFDCSSNNLKTLKGAPIEVGGDFWCIHNQLKTLEYSPKKVSGAFHCYDNPWLISLEGAPESIEGGLFLGNISFEYNLESFLEEMKQMDPHEISLLLTHRFFTPEVIKEQITKNPNFPYYVSLAWNTEAFKQKQDELKKILPGNILVKIDDLWSIGGYL